MPLDSHLLDSQDSHIHTFRSRQFSHYSGSAIADTSQISLTARARKDFRTPALDIAENCSPKGNGLNELWLLAELRIETEWTLVMREICTDETAMHCTK